MKLFLFGALCLALAVAVADESAASTNSTTNPTTSTKHVTTTTNTTTTKPTTKTSKATSSSSSANPTSSSPSSSANPTSSTTKNVTTTSTSTTKTTTPKSTTKTTKTTKHTTMPTNGTTSTTNGTTTKMTTHPTTPTTNRTTPTTPTTNMTTKSTPTTKMTTKSTPTTKMTTKSTPTTTAKPTPAPAGHWVIRDKNKNVCFMATMTIGFNLHWMNKAGKRMDSTFKLDAKSAMMVKGDNGSMCDDDENRLVVAMNFPKSDSNDGDDEHDLVVTLGFTKAEKGKEFRLSSANSSAVLKSSVFKNIVDKLANHTECEGVMVSMKQKNPIKAALKHSYECQKAATDINMTPGADKKALLMVDLKLMHVQVQAFMNADNSAAHKWGDAEYCQADFATNDVVPIAVGAALAALVGIVLVAYLIGRRRSRARGYESM